jgi:hypothetical protein
MSYFLLFFSYFWHAIIFCSMKSYFWLIRISLVNSRRYSEDWFRKSFSRSRSLKLASFNENGSLDNVIIQLLLSKKAWPLIFQVDAAQCFSCLKWVVWKPFFWKKFNPKFTIPSWHDLLWMFLRFPGIRTVLKYLTLQNQFFSNNFILFSFRFDSRGSRSTSGPGIRLAISKPFLVKKL